MGGGDGSSLGRKLLRPAAASIRVPSTELAALYHERWEIETAYDELKTHMLDPRPILRSKTPDLVRQEVEGLMLAYYAVRAFLAEAADHEVLDPDDLSFVPAVRVVRHRLQNSGPRRRPRAARIRDLCRELREELVVSSRGLRRPRGVKRKMSNYPIRRAGPLDRQRHTWMPLILAPACLGVQLGPVQGQAAHEDRRYFRTRTEAWWRSPANRSGTSSTSCGRAPAHRHRCSEQPLDSQAGRTGAAE